MDIKEIALKVADSLRNKVDGISHMQSNQGLVRFAEAFIASYKAELLKEVGESVLYAEFAEDGGWLGDASEYADHLEEPHALFTSEQVSAAILKAAKPLEDQLAKAEQRVAEWQPIETAPKDGSVIVVGYGRQGNFPVKVVYWKELHKIWMHYGEWEPGLENNATHWMPLPKAPANGASS